ncbi:Lrp/AsnC family transcriptional regulator [Umezawaea endophytica]|uniref:Lrp/AsnC family transcriptional regulator n=1 Tax=Umezawaea endophytica TaxID=1654476 RepID=A0A9X2VLC1_9PSEU|nr:Lrp/AsnC family transcriptional regulator [Umezawaea endophytica]MCS7478616.1 Lrp/AsnC family transcriptional regulator [Umezawaea endophytica]
MSNKVPLDSVDREILFHLRQDGRLTNVELAKRVGLTPPPCLRRVKRLEDAGIITGYRARVDLAATGRGFEVIVTAEIRVNDRETVDELEALLRSYDEVVECRRLFGRPDYLMRVRVEDAQAYEKFLVEKVMSLPPMARVDSHLTMREVKSED